MIEIKQPETGRQNLNIPPKSVEISELIKRYKTSGGEYIFANNNISLEVFRGEIFGLLGPNGAGKTTLVNQILGLARPDSGKITVEGVDPSRNPERLKTLAAYLPQQGMAFSQIEVRKALIYAGQLRGMKNNEAQAQATRLIEQLELAEVANRTSRTLSGGMRRLVAFAITLMGHPRLLVLDEPTNELDPARRRLVWETIKNLNLQNGVTCLLVTHNVLEAEQVLGRLAIISQGRLVALGTPGEIKKSNQTMAHLELVLTESFSYEAPPHDKLMAHLQEEGISDQVRLERQGNNYRRFRLYLPSALIETIGRMLVSRVGLLQIDDFRLSLPSLEEVYLEMVGKTEHGQEVRGDSHE